MKNGYCSEKELMEQLKHSSIMEIFDGFQLDRWSYLVMELADFNLQELQRSLNGFFKYFRIQLTMFFSKDIPSILTWWCISPRVYWKVSFTCTPKALSTSTSNPKTFFSSTAMLKSAILMMPALFRFHWALGAQHSIWLQKLFKIWTFANSRTNATPGALGLQELVS